MRIVCPECHTLHEFKTPLDDHTITCEKCKTTFLTPIEALPDTIQSREDLEISMKELEDAFAIEKSRLSATLNEQYKITRGRIEQAFERAEIARKKKAERSEAKSVKNPIANKLHRFQLIPYVLNSVIVSSKQFILIISIIFTKFIPCRPDKFTKINLG